MTVYHKVVLRDSCPWIDVEQMPAIESFDFATTLTEQLYSTT